MPFDRVSGLSKTSLQNTYEELKPEVDFGIIKEYTGLQNTYEELKPKVIGIY